MERTMARLSFESGTQIVPYTEEMLIRDKHMSDKIALLMRAHPAQCFAHITGWQHLRDPYGSMRGSIL